MNREQILLTNIMYNSKKELDNMPEWAKAERLYNCDIPLKSETKITRKIHVRKAIAHSLRGIANVIDPLKAQVEQA